MTIRTIIESIRAWFAGPITQKEPVMADEAAAQQPANASVTAVSSLTARTTALTTDTDLLKKLLTTLGHDLEAEWEHLVALSQKAL